MDFKDTLLMPKTEFPMRGNLGTRELEIQKRWKDIDLYNEVLKKNKDGKPFILHDGPPYANGNIHIGHAFQKTLKDFVLRYKTMSGFYTPYIPGWDTHGLPIEVEVTKKVNRKETSVPVFRKVCRDFALEQVAKQRKQFERLGILGEWENPYLTLDKSFESSQLEVFAKMIDHNLISRGLKPIYWSFSSESALAEAEIEYKDKKSLSIYFTFEIVEPKELLGVNLLVWTTTPWTLPANLAVSVHPDYTYVRVKVANKEYLLLEKRLEELSKILAFGEYQIGARFKGSELEYLKYKHPLYERISPVILGTHVLDTDGTGLVHTAPGHGVDDYIVGKNYNLDVLSPVDAKGYMTSEALKYSGMFYEKANEEIVNDLEISNSLVKKEIITHSYPHDWRTKKPVIFRATPQWFIDLASIKEKLLSNIDSVNWLPSWGKTRLANMVSLREDWCISRQRVWGIPIPVFYNEDGSTILDSNIVRHVSKLFLEHGADIWYEWDAVDLLPSGYKNKLSPNNRFTKETDIMDVWFDSGTSYKVLEKRGLPFPADLYLEGSDQYRGWFNSSLTCAVAEKGISPYKSIVSHGFVLDSNGFKMSKSLNNVIDPLSVIKEHGADILRLWAATVDYQSDVRIGELTISQTAESYRKIRNTIRFMLGNLNGFIYQSDYVSYSMRTNLNRITTLKLKQLRNSVIKAYDSYNFYDVYRLIMPFIVNDLSAFYLDFTKDILYIEKAKSFKRIEVLSVLYDITLELLKLLTPIIPHTTSESYRFLSRDLADIYLERIDCATPLTTSELEILAEYKDFEHFRSIVLKELEGAREEKVIGKSLEAQLDITISPKLDNYIKSLGIELKQLLIVSKVNIVTTNTEEPVVLVKKMVGQTCLRCWNVYEHLDSDSLCERCCKIIKGDK